MKHNKYCPICGSNFNTNRRSQTYCCRECASVSRLAYKKTKSNNKKIKSYNEYDVYFGGPCNALFRGLIKYGDKLNQM